MKDGDRLPDSHTYERDGSIVRITDRVFIEREQDETELQRQIRIKRNEPPKMISYVQGRLKK